ncbi:hypothetical protein AB0H76_34925 [Nocardia sp. NPDC050712]|uniref:hypothetical protein n=1 Tax=Nocardia sp. NPDC050712 TaxID=3155518 RepID=UPI0033F70508
MLTCKAIRYPYNPQPAYPAASEPSKVTAIAAAIFAAIAGLIAAGITVFSIYVVVDIARTPQGRSHADDLPDLSGIVLVGFFLLGVVSGVLALLYLLGALLLFLRKTAGRVLVIMATVPALAANVFAFGQDLSVRNLEDVGRFATFLLCVAIVILAALPSTGRWIAAGKKSAPPQGYPAIVTGLEQRR